MAARTFRVVCDGGVTLVLVAPLCLLCLLTLPRSLSRACAFCGRAPSSDTVPENAFHVSVKKSTILKDESVRRTCLMQPTPLARCNMKVPVEVAARTFRVVCDGEGSDDHTF